MLTGIFVLALLATVYTYFGYPLLLWTLNRFTARPSQQSDELLPSVTMLFAAHQESSIIREKLENFKQLDYPKELMKLVVVSDGSTDGTDELVAYRCSNRIRLFRQEPRQGKAAALGMALPEIDTDVVLFTDANVMFAPDAIRRLVRHFADPEVGVVTGKVQLVDHKTGYAESEGLYYRYEHFLQRQESLFWSVIGVDGAMYAVRRELVEAPPREAILDDFITSMRVACKGARIVYDPSARAVEDAAPCIRDEMRRKIRVAAGAFQSLRHGWGVPGLGQARLWFSYVSHKALRWSAWVLLLAMLAVSVVLGTSEPVWAGLLALQVLFYALAGVGVLVPPLRGLRLVSIPMYFTIMNAAFAVGLVRAIQGRTNPRWRPVRRTKLRPQ